MGNQQNYAENKTENLESVQNIVFNLTPNKEYIIKFDENENTRSEKRKRVHKTSSLQENADKIKEYIKNYNETYTEKVKQKRKKYYETNPDKIKETRKKYYETH